MEALRPKQYQVVPGEYYGSPKEVWGFRTAPSRGAPRAIAREFLAANAPLLKLEGLRLGVRRVVPSLGAWHVILEQAYRGVRIHRAYVTVHIGRDHRVYLAKNRAIPGALLPDEGRWTLGGAAARLRAQRALPKGGRRATAMSAEKLWFPVRKTLRPAWRVRMHRARPREEWLVVVDAENGRILSRYDNLALAPAVGLVFDPNPVIALGDWKPLLVKRGRKVVPATPPAACYARVALRGLAGRGTLDGPRASTAPTRNRVRRPDGRFLLESRQNGFEEVMVYFHVDRAIRYLESLGYRGARAIFRKPLPANARGTREDNSWYSPGLRQLTFGTGGVDDAEDGETILHEFGHAVQDAICPDFGQSAEAAAMGEGFGDYFAASSFAAKKAPRFRAAVMSWDAIRERPERPGEPPCWRRLDEKMTYRDFDASANADEHVNGMIWSATLWDIWNALGRAVADPIVVESHFQLDGFTTFARGARAILDADRNLHRGRYVKRLTRIFAARGIGPVA